MPNLSRLLATIQVKHTRKRNKQIQHASPTSLSNTQSNAQMIFYGSKPKQNSSWVMAQTHAASGEQVGKCVPAQINIWLTLQNGYYLSEISEREVGGLAGFWLPSYFFSFAVEKQVSLAVTQCLSDIQKDCETVPGSWPKCVKDQA